MHCGEILLSAARLFPVAVAVVFLFEAFRRALGSSVYGCLLAFVVVELIAALEIECLSLFSAYRPLPATIFWAMTALLTCLAWRHTPRTEWSHRPYNRWELMVLVACLGMLLGTLITALYGAPNTWDALTYHLPRVMHWLQNASIAHYPTPIQRQLKMPPLAEMLVSQTVLLTGGDRLVNLVQWVGYGTTALAIYAIIRRSQLPLLAGANGALMFLSVPMAVLQASGPKNDLVLCANLGAAAAFLQAGYQPLRWTWIGAGAVGLGLAVLTKGTALIFGGVVAAAFVVAVGRRHGLNSGFRVGVVLALAIVSINAAHWGRNLRLFGAPLGPATEGPGYEWGTQRRDFGTLASNLLRNVALNLETPSDTLNRSIEIAVATIHERMGLRQYDSATTWPDATLQLRHFPSRDEDSSGNPLHLLMILGALVAILFVPRAVEQKGFALLVACGLVLATMAFCLLLKWQIWHTRLQLPLFAAGCVLVPSVTSRRQRALAVTLLFVTATSVSTLLQNGARPLTGPRNVFELPRSQNLLGSDKHGARQLAERLAQLHTTRLGLYLGGDDPEYLIWYIARKATPGVRIFHIGVTAPFGLTGPTLPPAEIVVTYSLSGEEDIVRMDGQAYGVDRRCGHFTLWRLIPSG